jgi:diadenylate cyclase
MENLLLFVSSIRWQDIVDIVLNSYILFRLYVLFRGTPVLRVLIGIALLWFSQRVAVALGLVLTSWAIQGITAAAALIIIVVFRNEIRSVLQAKNLKAILWGVPHQTGETPVETIAETAFELANKRVGAIMVFPGADDLDELIQGGIGWDGLVSREMIGSIFWHDNPVHDGAAIIQGNRIKKVAAVLPLSRRDDLPSRYGTRHRAAVGLAEMTDAMVLVVSEERGSVVLVKGTEIRTIRKKEVLTEAIEEHVGSTKTQWGYRRKEKRELAVAALASLILITAVWFSFTRGQESLVAFDIPVEYVNRNPATEIVDTSVNTIHVGLSGPGTLIKSLRPDQVKVRLDLSKAAVGHNSFAITSDDIDLPPGLVLRKVKPSTVEVTLDVPQEKILPVQVDWVGKLRNDLILTGAKVVPARVKIKGGKTILDGLSTIYTEKVRLDQIEKSGSLKVKLALEPATLMIAAGSSDTVTVDYVVEKRALDLSAR